ncbi:MAG: hypothetical protein K8R36_25295 [Planctomycetales bacterium]|nr:hypothetical protein [Planctomycetales bacterium]
MLESLEDRSLLSGFHHFAPVHIADHHPAIVSTTGTSSTRNSASAAGQQSETHFVATLADPNGVSTVTGTAKFESETENGVSVNELVVQVKGGTPASTLNVVITDSAGTSTTVGQITIAADGTGQLKLKTGVPAVDATSTIALTTSDAAATTLASGPFAAPANNPNGSHGHCGESNEVHLVASLTDSNSTLTGKAHFESETENGANQSKLSVRIQGATPGAVIDVSIAADSSGTPTSVGQIIIGADGTGRLKLKTGVPAVTSTSVITLSLVTTVNGTTTTTPITSATFAAPSLVSRRTNH